MKIATWNVNSINVRLEAVTAWLTRHRPDVLMLQELKTTEFPADAFTALGYQSAIVTQKTYNGVAILSRAKLTTVLAALPDGAGDEQARYLEADCNGLRLACLYLPNGNPVDSDKFSYKLSWMTRLKNRLAQLRRDGVSVAAGGDYNVIPEDKDCHDPAAWTGDALFRPESRAAFRALINLGYYDALRIHDRRTGQYSYWDYQGGAWPQDKGIRIDHFLLSPDLADRLVSCSIDKEPRAAEKSSDHVPVMIELAA